MTASPRPEPKAKRPLLEAARIVKVYGPTVAVSEMDLTVAAGEVLGLVGANGAGKSTLMRILAGVTAPDAGELSFVGEVLDWAVYSPATARRLGMRTVYQELSLCTNLTVYENFFIEQPQRFKAQAWRKQAREIAREALDTVFPGNTIDVSATLSELAIAQRQMVEIARATSDLELKLLILDEPTSSLAAEQTAQLQAYVMAKRQSGVSFVFISHRLSEVLSLADKIVVMKNGMLSWAGQPSETSKADLVVKMGGKSADGLPAAHAQATGSRSASLKKTLRLVAKDLNTESLHDLNLQLQSGEIVGLAGLEGSGQQALLQALFEARR
jgi:ribose transport system ATP-binding protein